MIAYPEATLGELAAALQKTPSWISSVKNSDMFVDYWRRRSQDHSDAVTRDVKAKGLATAEMALEHLHKKLESPDALLLTTETLLNVVDVTMKRFGYDNGPASKAPAINVNLGLVTAEQLAEARAKLRKAEEIIDAEAVPALPAPKEAAE
jgi:hypothetical protein